jgi:hypothetical protein
MRFLNYKPIKAQQQDGAGVIAATPQGEQESAVAVGAQEEIRAMLTRGWADRAARLYRPAKRGVYELEDHYGIGDGSPFVIDAEPDLAKILNTPDPPIPQRLTAANRSYWADADRDTKLSALAIAYLQHPVAWFRLAAIDHLGDIRGLLVEQALIDLLADPFEEVAEAAARAIWAREGNLHCSFAVRVLRDEIRGHSELGLDVPILGRRAANVALDRLAAAAPSSEARQTLDTLIAKEIVIEERTATFGPRLYAQSRRNRALMSYPHHFEVDSVEKAVALASELMARDEYNIFRGQTVDWPMRPSLIRLGPSERRVATQKMLEFAAFVERTSELTAIHRKRWEVWGIAQHYGIPTVLRDFTTNPLVAGWFASHGRSSNSSRQSIIYIAHRDFVNKVYRDTLPQLHIVRIAVDNLWRLQAQSGLFFHLPFEGGADLDHRLAEAFGSIRFPYRDPFNGIPQAAIYPPRKSRLEILLDRFYTQMKRKQLLILFKEMGAHFRTLRDGIVGAPAPDLLVTSRPLFTSRGHRP